MATAIITNAQQSRMRDVAEAFSAEAIANAESLETQVNVIARAKRDAIAKTDALRVVVSPYTSPALSIEEVPQHVVIATPNDGPRVAIAALAHDQIADRVKIPRDYYWRMLASQPALLAENVNTWFQREPDKRLLRMLAPISDADNRMLAATGTQLKLRGFMGHTYRPIDNAELLAELLPVARARGALLKTYGIDERRVHAQFITREQSIQAIRDRVAQQYGVDASRVTSHVRVGDRDVSWVDEVIRSGFYFRNSEVGFAALEITSFMDILKCLNGMIKPAEVVQRHIGGSRSQATDELAWLSSTTQTLDNAALISRARDAALAALDDRSIVKLGNTVLAAKAESLDLGEPVFEWVDRAADKLQLNDTQRAIFIEETVNATVQEKRELVSVGGAQRLHDRNTTTKFALVQGLTATARQIEDMDRRAELEKTGWSWLEGDTRELLKLGSEPSQTKRAKSRAAKQS